MPDRDTSVTSCAQLLTFPRNDMHEYRSPDEGTSRRALEPSAAVKSSFALVIDVAGSGAETIAHLRENGRITFMFCAFDGKPNIVRLYGQGRTVRPGDAEWTELIDLFAGSDVVRGAVRSIVVADIDRTSTSCGYSVPFMDFTEDRRQLLDRADNKSADDLAAYWADNNAESIDGLPALD
jgi:hypothetical protein